VSGSRHHSVARRAPVRPPGVSTLTRVAAGWITRAW